MKFRYARHTNNLKALELFYTKIVGLQKLGEFKNHNNYDGIFLGLPNQSWHLEFTTSNEAPKNKFDEDDILVFYVNTQNELNEKLRIIELNKIKIETPKNPYWNQNGIMISDPDGFKIIFSVNPIAKK